MIDLHHPEGAEYNIDGHIFNTWEFYAFLAASILAADDLEISAEGKEFLIFLADTYMVDVVLAEDLLITTLRYQRIKAGPGARPEGIHLRAEIAPAAR
ncbi:MAG: hypothetical protein OXI72_24505 [Gemmatimonadota bacterium]|nr:hypothetical protein [Gemmatimonadota bacterium]